ncbi:hypothetical protein ACA910_007603 [Epithemia clementina (nom. ined.)]
MVRELSYNTAAIVLDSWEQVRRTPDFEREVGALLFRDMFQRSPEIKVLFGFPIDLDANSPQLRHDKKFLQHATYMVQMLDATFNMLGPDLELLTEIMQDLGAKHARYGVKAAMHTAMQESLLHVLEQVLGSQRFSSQVKDAWIEVYGQLSQDMIQQCHC